jgi:hypothetical protein
MKDKYYNIIPDMTLDKKLPNYVPDRVLCVDTKPLSYVPQKPIIMPQQPILMVNDNTVEKMVEAQYRREQKEKLVAIEDSRNRARAEEVGRMAYEHEFRHGYGSEHNAIQAQFGAIGSYLNERNYSNELGHWMHPYYADQWKKR